MTRRAEWVCLVVSGLSMLLALRPTPGLAGPVVFGPETFERFVGEPVPVVRPFSVDDPSGTYWLQITNGSGGMRLVQSAAVVLNGHQVISPNEFRGHVFGFSKDVNLEINNVLEVEVRGSPGTLLTVEIRKADAGQTFFNRDADIWGAREPGLIGLWWEPEDAAVEYVVFRGPSMVGPWQEVFRRPGHRPNGIDLSPEAQSQEVCYRVEGLDALGRVIHKYDPICFPPGVGVTNSLLNVGNPSVEQVGVGSLSDLQPFNTMCLSDAEFEASNAMSEAEIREFLASRNSFLRTNIVDVDGVLINPSQLIFDAAQSSQVSPQAILVTLEKEQRAVRTAQRLPDSALRLIMGFDPGHRVVRATDKSIREQIRDAAAQWRRDLNRLGAVPPEPTAGGWQVGVPKLSDDGVLVTPARRTVAVLFSYTPEVGQGWGGGVGVGGNFLFCELWRIFGFAQPECFDSGGDAFTPWLSGAAYQAEFDQQATARFYPVQVEGRTCGGASQFRGRFVPFPPDPFFFYSIHGHTQQSYETFNSNVLAQGFTQIWLQTFVDADGILRFQSTWIKTTP